MFKKPHCPVIAIEEHYWDDELEKSFTGGEAGRPGEQYMRLKDLGALRLKEMDEAGIDIQVLSHGAPSTQKLPADSAPAIARRVNDRLQAVVSKNPQRFAAFAALPTAVPEAAADEFERTAALGFKGAMLHGLAGGVFLDDKRFWPIYQRAEQLDLPVYLHPSLPQADVMRIYYQDYAKDFPMITRATWGYTVETATLALRLVLSGVFEKYPKLNIILGHLGETLPFLVWRVDTTLKRPGGKGANFRVFGL
jgi:2,3-dihydroxybenzoate decarboxylase